MDRFDKFICNCGDDGAGAYGLALRRCPVAVKPSKSKGPACPEPDIERYLLLVCLFPLIKPVSNDQSPMLFKRQT